MFEFKIRKELSGKKVKLRFKEEVEPQETLLDSLSQREDLISERRFEVPLKKRTLRAFCFLFLALIFLLLIKSFQLQILDNKKFSKLSENNFQKIYFKRADRGVIYDKDLNQLVFNDFSFDLICEKQNLPFSPQEKEKTLNQISGIIGQDIEVILEKIEKSTDSKVLISENLEHEILVLLEAKIEELSGFSIEENIKRVYSEGASLSHLIGYLGRIQEKEIGSSQDYLITDYVGKSGIEKSYESILKGEKEKILVVKDVLGRESSREKISEQKSGESLVLWLDSELQNKIKQELEKSLERTGAESAAAIAINPKTGGILSLVSLPSFDNNIFFEKKSLEEWQLILDDPKDPFFNRAISGVYATGSTIKPLIAAAALEENIITSQKQILCEGKIIVENPWFPDEPWIFGDWKTHGWTDMRKAIAESCNVYFYTIGGGNKGIKGLGAEKIKQYLELFGWGKETGIDVFGEAKGLIPDKNWKEDYFEEEEQQIWLPGDTYNLSIGQGYLSITPLQVATSFVPIANQGKLLKPQIVHKIVRGSKGSFEVIQEFQPQVEKEDLI